MHVEVFCNYKELLIITYEQEDGKNGRSPT